MTPVVLVSTDGKRTVRVNVEAIEPAQYQQVSDLLEIGLAREKQTYVGVSAAMQLAVKLAPKANPADLWVHLIYHQFRNRFGKIDQSWKRVAPLSARWASPRSGLSQR